MKIGVRKTKTPKVDGIRNLNMSLEINLGVT
jgi:hypothetical protein